MDVYHIDQLCYDVSCTVISQGTQTIVCAYVHVLTKYFELVQIVQIKCG